MSNIEVIVKKIQDEINDIIANQLTDIDIVPDSILIHNCLSIGVTDRYVYVLELTEEQDNALQEYCKDHLLEIVDGAGDIKKFKLEDLIPDIIVKPQDLKTNLDLNSYQQIGGFFIIGKNGEDCFPYVIRKIGRNINFIDVMLSLYIPELYEYEEDYLNNPNDEFFKKLSNTNYAKMFQLYHNIDENEYIEILKLLVKNDGTLYLRDFSNYFKMKN